MRYVEGMFYDWKEDRFVRYYKLHNRVGLK